MPRTRSDCAAAEVPALSMVTATCGRAASAPALGAVVAVHTTIASPVQKKPHGTTRGKPSVPS